MNHSDLVLVGGGGHCRSCIDVIEEYGAYHIVGILERADHRGDSLDGYPYLGTDEDIPRLAAEGRSFLVTVGQIESGQVRERLFVTLKRASAAMAIIVSPLAHVARRVEIGEGTIVMHHALVNAGARIGANCILNSSSLVEHDAMVGSHCHVSTAAVVNGGCRIGSRVFIGSNSVIRHGVVICDEVVVGAGAVVVKDISEPGTWLGNPASRRT